MTGTHTMSFDPITVEEAGIDPARLDIFLRRVRLEVEQGALPSAQVAVARHGRLVVSETYGDVDPRRKFILQSVGRTVVAATIWKLIGEGLISVDERVGDVIPEFATNGKDVVTIEQVLTHTGGFPFAPLGYPKMLERSRRLEAFGKWRLDWEPGTRLQFHLTSAAWVIAELVERRTGLPFADYLRQEIVEPLGLGFVLPVPADRFEEVVAVPIAIDRTSADQEVDPWGPWYLANGPVLAGGEPSHSIVGNAADVALFFQALYHSGLWADGRGRRRHHSARVAPGRWREALRRQPRDRQHRPVLHGQRRIRWRVDAAYGLAAHVRSWRRAVPARLHGPRRRYVLRVPHPRLPTRRLRLQPGRPQPHHQPRQPRQRPRLIAVSGATWPARAEHERATSLWGRTRQSWSSSVQFSGIGIDVRAKLPPSHDWITMPDM